MQPFLRCPEPVTGIGSPFCSFPSSLRTDTDGRREAEFVADRAGHMVHRNGNAMMPVNDFDRVDHIYNLGVEKILKNHLRRIDYCFGRTFHTA